MPPRPTPRVLDAAAVASFVLFALAAWWPTRDLPYFWDGAGFITVAARDMVRTGFVPLVPTHEFYAHPPLFVALVALAWRIFGESRLVAHLVVLPFLPLAMAATYFLGVRAHGRLLGFAAAALFGATALTLCELGQIYFDLPLAAIVACALLAWVSDRPLLAGVLFAIAAWTKLSAAAVPVALAALLALDPARRREPRRWVGLALPPAATLAWLVYHRAVIGWWLTDSSEAMIPLEATTLAFRAWLVIRSALLERHRYALLIVAAIGAWRLHRRGEPIARPELAPLAACVLGGIALFVASTFLPRYALFFFPAYYVGALLLARLALSDRAFTLVTGLLVALFVVTWHPRVPRTSTFELTPSEDLSYLDMIRIGREAAAYVEKKHGDATIYGGFHEGYQLGEPWQGYVTRALDVRPCVRFVPGDRDAHPEQLVYIHAYETEQEACRRIVELTHAVTLRRFESNGKWIEVWRVPRP